METVWTVEGMTCGHCATSVREEIEEIPGVTEVVVDHATGVVKVTSAEAPERDLVAAAVTEAGYTLV